MKATKTFADSKNFVDFQANPSTPFADSIDKVAIFGGSFDPPHLAHFEIISWLSKHFGQVIVIPAYQNPLKSTTTIPLQTRLEWCKKMCENIDNVIISDIEAQNNRVMFACELARYFYAKYFGKNLLSNTNKQKSQNFSPPLYFVIGEDCLANLHKWKNINELSSLVDFVVLQRSGAKSSQKKASQKDFMKSKESSQKDSSKTNDTDLLDFANIYPNIHPNIHYVDFCPNALLDFGLNGGDISSTFLRKYLAQNLSSQPSYSNQSNKDNKDNNEKIAQALPQNLRDEVLAFFAKTSLQF